MTGLCPEDIARAESSLPVFRYEGGEGRHIAACPMTVVAR